MQKNCQVAVVDITVISTLLSSTPYCWKETLISVVRLPVASDPERFRGGYHGTNGET